MPHESYYNSQDCGANAKDMYATHNVHTLNGKHNDYDEQVVKTKRNETISARDGGDGIRTGDSDDDDRSQFWVWVRGRM